MHVARALRGRCRYREDMIYHVGEEAGVVISGVIEITVGDLVETLGPGDAYYFDTSVPHRMRNVGACRVLWSVQVHRRLIE